MKRDRRRHRFVVGHTGECQCVYGPDGEDGTMFVDPMTLGEARVYLQKLIAGTPMIYELMPRPDLIPKQSAPQARKE